MKRYIQRLPMRIIGAVMLFLMKFEWAYHPETCKAMRSQLTDYCSHCGRIVPAKRGRRICTHTSQSPA